MNRRTKKGLTRTALAIVFMLVALWLGSMDRQDAVDEAAHYCAMHRLWIASAGKHGWPDYAGRFEEECHP